MLDPLSQQTSIVTSLSRTSATNPEDKPQVSRSAQQKNLAGTQPDEQKTQNTSAAGKNDSVQISQEAREIARLSARDREVKAHEAAHAAVGGRYAGPPTMTYKKGPDGRSYAIAGEVSISLTAVSGDPQATLQKAEIIRAAALAPAQPSTQDLQIAARATMMAAQARTELSRSSSEAGDPADETDVAAENTPEATPSMSADSQPVEQSGSQRTKV